VLASVELGEFRILDPDRRRRFFLQRWTAKEALLKAAGVGLGADPSRISLLADRRGGFLGDAGSLGLFHVQAVHELPGFVAAVATDAATPLGVVRVEIERNSA
jgi:phosphopantetheinyl transferase